MKTPGENRPAVIATMSYSGLALARSLARRGVTVYGVASSADEIGMTSRYVIPKVYPNIIRSDRDTVDALLDLAAKIGGPAVLFPTGDALVLPLSRHREELRQHYRFLVPEADIVEQLVSKDGLSAIVRQRNVPGPSSATVLDAGQLELAERELRYPALIKPIYSASWYLPEMVSQIGSRKIVVVKDRDELRSWYGRIAAVDPRVIVQELIPGEDSRLYYVAGYFNADGELEAAVAGQKVRITPIHSGSASFVESVRDDRLLEAARSLLQPLGYRGLFGVEFKLDPRDDVYKVIEVNVRWGLWDGLARRCGIDLGYLAYAREVGLPYEVNRDYRAGVKWLSFSLDLDAFLAYRKEHLLSLWSWLGSLRGETEYAVFAWDDLGPAVAEARAIARDKSRGLWSRLRRGSRPQARAPEEVSSPAWG